MSPTAPRGLLGRLTKVVLEGALEGEMDAHLGYAKHDQAGRHGENSRNGHRANTVPSAAGPVQIAVPVARSKSQIKSQTKSQRPQTRGVTRPQPATVVAGRCHIRRRQATSRDGKNLPYKRGAAGSNPVVPTKFPQVDGLFETLI